MDWRLSKSRIRIMNKKMMYHILESLQERKFNLSSLIRLRNENNEEAATIEIACIISNMKADLEDLMDLVRKKK